MSSLKAARADNFYYPKDWDPSKGSLNKFQNSHPLGDRAKKIDQGILVIRYETPFHVRCLKCDNMIAKGVRFNAEKRKVGKYMSSTIWEFKMRCPHCSNNIIVETDPENTDYNYKEGARRILNTENAKTDVQFIRDDSEKAKIQEDPFYNLENKNSDQKVAEIEKPRIQSMMQMSSDRYENDFDNNLLLRNKFRKEKKLLEKKEEEDKKNVNFVLPIAPTRQTDMLKVSKAHFKGPNIYQKNKIEKRSEILRSNIFQDKKQEEVNKVYKKIDKLPKSTQIMIKNSLKQNQKSQNQFNIVHKK
ncbi:hypothetical protein ABPG72_007789 [Tetrahymena utriculariae]